METERQSRGAAPDSMFFYSMPRQHGGALLRHSDQFSERNSRATRSRVMQKSTAVMAQKSTAVMAQKRMTLRDISRRVTASFYVYVGSQARHIYTIFYSWTWMCGLVGRWLYSVSPLCVTLLDIATFRAALLRHSAPSRQCCITLLSVHILLRRRCSG
jgi:hypothetical protein